jgi:hypothetical protein
MKTLTGPQYRIPAHQSFLTAQPVSPSPALPHWGPCRVGPPRHPFTGAVVFLQRGADTPSPHCQPDVRVLLGVSSLPVGPRGRSCRSSPPCRLCRVDWHNEPAMAEDPAGGAGHS